jgi:protein phosphatase
MDSDYGIICDVGGKPKGNEDSAFFLEFDMIIAPGAKDSKHFAYKSILAIVCDGVSASSHGEKGSTFVVRNLPKKILQYLMLEPLNIAEIQRKLFNFINEINNELLAFFKDDVEKGKIPKTTLVGILIIGQWLWCFNLGDSRAYLIKDGQIGQISVDHVGTGAAHEITQAIGEKTVSPEVRFYNWAYESDYTANNLAFTQHYYFVISSDGLTDKVSPEEIKAIIVNEYDKTMQERVEKLYDLTMKRQIEDNVSIISLNMKYYFDTLNPIQKIKLSYPTQNPIN